MLTSQFIQIVSNYRLQIFPIYFRSNAINISFIIEKVIH